MWWSNYCDQHMFDQAQNWPTAWGTIVEVKKAYNYLGRRKYFSNTIAVAYDYDVDGRRYRGIQDQFLDRPYDRELQLGSGWSLRSECYYQSAGAKSIAEEFMKGSVAAVHYDSKSPAVSFIDTKFAASGNYYLNQAISIGLMAFGFVGFLFGASGFDQNT
jgi:hypothetical protein